MKLERIGNIAQFINGAPFKPEDWCENGMKIIRIQNLTDPSKPYNKTNKIVDGKYIVTKGDVLVSWSATIDVFTWEDEDALLNQHIFKVIFDKSKVDKSYFINALKETINELTKLAHGATMKHVVKGDFENHKIPLPPLSDQLHIANLLTKAENLIAQRKESIALLDDYLKSTYNDLFSKYEGKNIQRLEAIASITSGLTKGKKYEGKRTRYLPYMRVANVQDGYLNLQEIKEIEATEDEINRYNLKFGDLLLTEGGDPDKLGRGTTWKNQIQDCIFQNHIFRVRINDIERINPVFLSFQTGSIYGKKYFLKSAKQTTGIASINSTQLKKFPAFIPPLALQTQFAQIVEKTEVLKTQYQQSLTELENLYGSLSQKAFKGELTLPKAEEQVLMAAEPEVKYGKGTTELTKRDAFLRKLMLASHIVYELCEEPTFGHTKLMKLLYLCEQVGGMALQTNYKKFAAGPFDGKTLTLIDQEYEKNKWFKFEKRGYTVGGIQREATVYKKTEKSLCYKNHFDHYFEQEAESINRLISLFRRERTQTAEVVATLYFAWKELIANKTIVSEPVLIKAFYDFHQEKKKFTKEQIIEGYRFMQKEGVCPK